MITTPTFEIVVRDTNHVLEIAVGRDVAFRRQDFLQDADRIPLFVRPVRRVVS